MKPFIASILAVTVLAFAAAVAHGETATVEVTGGSLSLTAANVSFGQLALTGSDQTANSASTSNTWTAIDARGTGAGWNITVASTNFSNGLEGASEKVIDITGSNSKFKISIADSDVTTNSGNTKPTSSVTSATDLGSVALKVVSAAVDTGMGNYTIKPAFSVGIPADTYAGTYTATVTVTVATGP